MTEHEPQPGYATEFSGILLQLQNEGGSRDIENGWRLEVDTDGIIFHHPSEYAGELAGQTRYFLESNGRLCGTSNRTDATAREIEDFEAAALVGSLRSLVAAGPDRRNVLH